VEAVGEGTQFIVSCGKLWSDQEVVIADPETMTECAAGNVGEVWITGPSVAKGYWNRIEETEYTLKAYLKDTGRGPFLRTGDMGFVKDRQLFITGRIKDLIIVRGRNHYPQDIELTWKCMSR
jgi:acyl-CoA synthetase (AMP-forming)/AMP-acid ligase II